MLRATGLTRRYGGVTALSEVDISLTRGEVHAVVGENGAGKSTLVKILSGVVRPDAGALSLGGAPVTFSGAGEAVGRGVALVAQELAVFPDLTVAENLFPLSPPRRGLLLSRRRMAAQAEPVLAELGLDVQLGARAGSLSLADQQLLEIGRALLRNPAVLILDEPTSALPREAVERLMAVLRRLVSRGVAVLYVSHFIEEVLRIASRITVLRDGRVVLAGVDVKSVDLDGVVAAMLGDRAPAAGLGGRASAGGESLPGSSGRASVGGEPLGEELRQTGPGGRASADPLASSLSGRPPAAPDRPSISREGLPPAVVVEGLRGADLVDVSFSVAPGEIVGFAGLQGSGHLAVLSVLSGRASAAGWVSVNGAPAPRSPRAAVRAGIAFVPSDRKRYGLMLDKPVWQNTSTVGWLALGRGGRWLHRRTHVEAALSLATRLRIRGGPHDLVSGLSGGNQQKVVVAKWLEAAPEILILDDPTRGVDIGARAEMHAVIAALAAGGKAVLLASTDLAELCELCDRVLVFQRGHVVARLTRAELSERALSVAMNAGFTA